MTLTRFRVWVDGSSLRGTAVREYGTALINDPERVSQIEKLGVDETSFQAASKDRRTRHVTAVVDLDRKVIADMVEDRKGSDLRQWLRSKGPDWLKTVQVVATDIAGSYRAGMKDLLDHTVKVVDGFHAVQAANRVVTTVRCRVQNDVFGHRGHKGDPLHKTRKLLLTDREHITEKRRDRLIESLRNGDPNDEALGAWLAKEIVRDVYLTNDLELAETLLSKAVKDCTEDPVPEIQTLGRTLTKWFTEILNHHKTRASNGPTEGLNLLIKKTNE